MSALTRLAVPDRPSEPTTRSSAQRQTEAAFGFKWAKRDTYESEAMQRHSRQWLLDRYCNGDGSQVDAWLEGGRKIILDAGCGAAYSAMLLFGDRIKDHDYLGVDISSSIRVARQRFAEAGYPGDFLQWDLLSVPVPDRSVDLIFSEGVLHHTDSTERSLKHLATKLRPGGRFLFYVYAKKGVVREFTDDHIREQLQSLTEEEAWAALEPLTKLGQALGMLETSVMVPEDVPLLGIKKGRYDLQRFVYWNVCKLFFRPDWSLDEMNHVNFDWFRPQNCHRHTPGELQQWVSEAGLVLERMHVEEAGITAVARRPETARRE